MRQEHVISLVKLGHMDEVRDVAGVGLVNVTATREAVTEAGTELAGVRVTFEQAGELLSNGYWEESRLQYFMDHPEDLAPVLLMRVGDASNTAVIDGTHRIAALYRMASTAPQGALAMMYSRIPAYAGLDHEAMAGESKELLALQVPAIEVQPGTLRLVPAEQAGEIAKTASGDPSYGTRMILRRR